jgi:hypothetical protein
MQGFTDLWSSLINIHQTLKNTPQDQSDFIRLRVFVIEYRHPLKTGVVFKKEFALKPKVITVSAPN